MEVNSTNKVTISHESEISQYLGVFNKLSLKVRFHNTGDNGASIGDNGDRHWRQWRQMLH